MADNIALNKKDQSKFSKKVDKVNEQLKSGVTKIKNQTRKWKLPRSDRGIVYLGHIPHGFYEEEMRNYFKQFGKVTSLRLCRSKKTGKSKGYAFIEFAEVSVAKIVAETMNNYLMFKKKLEAKFIPSTEVHPEVFKGKPWSEKYYPRKTYRSRINRIKNTNVDEKTHLERCKQISLKLDKNKKMLQELGINYEFTPVDIPDNLEINTDSSDADVEENDGPEYQQDPYDSDIEVRVSPSLKSNSEDSPSKKSDLKSRKSTGTLDTPSNKNKIKSRKSVGFTVSPSTKNQLMLSRSFDVAKLSIKKSKRAGAENGSSAFGMKKKLSGVIKKSGLKKIKEKLTSKKYDVVKASAKEFLSNGDIVTSKSSLKSKQLKQQYQKI